MERSTYVEEKTSMTAQVNQQIQIVQQASPLSVTS